MSYLSSDAGKVLLLSLVLICSASALCTLAFLFFPIHCDVWRAASTGAWLFLSELMHWHLRYGSSTVKLVLLLCLPRAVGWQQLNLLSVRCRVDVCEVQVLN